MRNYHSGDKESDDRHRFHHREQKLDGNTKGQYRFDLPSGKIQVVSYKQTGDEYLAKVNYLDSDKSHNSCLGLGKKCTDPEGDIQLENFDLDYDYTENEGRYGSPVHASEMTDFNSYLPLQQKYTDIEDSVSLTTPKSIVTSTPTPIQPLQKCRN